MNLFGKKWQNQSKVKNTTTKLKAKRLASPSKVNLLPIQQAMVREGDTFNFLNEDLTKLKAKGLTMPLKVNLPPIQ
jgi:hypothetical protein